jgi:hypothetical protein
VTLTGTASPLKSTGIDLEGDVDGILEAEQVRKDVVVASVLLAVGRRVSEIDLVRRLIHLVDARTATGEE